MPVVKIQTKTTYTLDVSLLTLGVEKQIIVDTQGLSDLHYEMEEFCKAIENILGAVKLPTYRSPVIRNPAPTASASKLMAYAQNGQDFTIKGASEALNIPEQTLYAAATKLIQEGKLVKTQVLGGLAHIYAISPKYRQQQAEVEKKPTIAVLPNGKVPFPDRGQNPEREKMQALRG